VAWTLTTIEVRDFVISLLFYHLRHMASPTLIWLVPEKVNPVYVSGSA